MLLVAAASISWCGAECEDNYLRIQETQPTGERTVFLKIASSGGCSFTSQSQLHRAPDLAILASRSALPTQRNVSSQVQLQCIVNKWPDQPLTDDAFYCLRNRPFYPNVVSPYFPPPVLSTNSSN